MNHLNHIFVTNIFISKYESILKFVRQVSTAFTSKLKFFVIVFAVLFPGFIASAQTTITTGNTVAASTINVGNTIIINAGGTLNMDVARSFTSITTANAGTSTISGSNLLTVTAAVTLTAGNTLVLNPNCNAVSLATANLSNTTATISGAGTLTLSGNININGANNQNTTLSLQNLQVSCVAINGGNGNNNTTFNLIVGSTTLKISGAVETGAQGVEVFTCNAGSNIEYNGGAQNVYATTYVNLTLSGSGAKTTTGASVNSTLSMQGTATTTGTAANYGAAATLEYKGTASQTTGTEFTSTFSGTGGVVINNSNGVTLNAIRTIGAASKLEIGSTVPNSVFNDGGFQLSSTGTLTLTSGTFNLGTAGAATTLPAFATKNYSAGTTVAFNSGVAQTIAATSYPNLTFSGAGTKNTATGTLTVSGNWSTTGGSVDLNTNNSNITVTGNITGTGNITSGSGTISIAGSWSNNGTFTANTGTVTYNGASQAIAALSYYNLNCNPASGGTSLSGATNVSNTLTISASTLNLLTHNLIIGASGSITVVSPSASKMILASGSGKVRKSFSGDGSFTFPIGDNTITPEYSPITIDVAGTAYNAAFVEVNVTDDKHPSNISPTHFISRYWDITQSGITNALINVTGTYVSADINGTEGSASAAQLDGVFDQTANPWVKYAALSANTLSANGASLTDGEISAFTGITGADPTVAITGGNVSVCPNVPVALSTNVTGDGSLIYLWSPSTGLSSTTVSDPTATVPTTTVYTVTIFDGNGITSSDNTTITIDPGPVVGNAGGITGSMLACNGEQDSPYSVSPPVNVTSYSWTVPPGASIESGNGTRFITVDFPDPYTTGQVCVTALNVCEIPSATRCTTVTNVLQYSPARITGPLNVCLNSTVNYEGLFVRGATSYNWTLPPGMAITAGTGTRFITVDVGPSATSGQLCLSVNYTCGTSLSYCVNVSISSSAIPGGITGPSSICSNSNGIVYSVSPLTGATGYTWTTPSGFTIMSGQGTNSITTNIGGSPVAGSVCVTATFACGSSLPRCKAVSINGIVAGPISGPVNICAGATGLVYSVPNVINATSYNWTLPSGLTLVSGINTRFITVDADVNFTQGDLCVSVTTSCGTSNAACITVKDFKSFTPGGISGPSLVCPTATGLVYSVGQVSGAVSYEWIVPPGIIITGGLNTRTITVSVDASFTIGDIGVRVVSACPSKSLIRWNSKTTTINIGMPEVIAASASICPGTTVSFSVTPAISGASSYIWTLPQGMTFTPGPPTNTSSVSVDIGAGYTQGQICVRAVSSCGIEGYTKCQAFNIIPNTPAAISGPAGVCPNAIGVVYSIPAVSGAASYSWSLPTGWNITSGSGTNSITVSVPANFLQGQIRVNAVTSCGLNGGTRALNVSNTPSTPGVISGATAICTGNTYIYSIDAVAGASSYSWSLPSGVAFTPGPPSNTNSISIDVSGGFTGGQICVTASTACGGPSIQRCISVGTTPATPGIIAGPAAVCQGATSVVYSISSLPGISTYNWILPADMSIVSGQGSTSLTVNIGGGFTSGQLCVEAQNACGAPGVSSCLNVSLTPQTPTAINVPTNFCPGSTKTLTVNTISGASTYDWSLPTGLTLLYGQGTSSVTVAIDGAYVSDNVCVTAYSSCSTASTQYCQTVSAAPATSPVSITSSSIVCAGSNVIFSIPTLAGAGSFDWSLPSGLNIVSGQGTATIEVSADPGYTIGNVCVTANSGCSTPSTQFCQSFSATPPSPGGITAPTAICANDPAVILSISPIAGASSYNWTLPIDMTIISGQNSNAITVSVGPGFTSGQVSVAAVSACAVAGSTRTLNVGSSIATPAVITPPSSICPNATGLVFSIPQIIGAVSYQWTLPASFTVTAGANTNVITVDVGPAFTTGQVCVAPVSVCGIPGFQNCINVNYLPNQPGSISGTTKGVCNQTLQYSVNVAAGALTYTWTPPAGASIISGQGTRIVQVNFSNAFVSGQLQVYTSNACGNSAIRTSAVIIGAPDKPTIISGLNSVCANQTAVAYSVPAVFNTTTYNWTVPAGAAVATGQGTTSITVDWGSTPGNVSVTATNTCGTSAATNLSVAISCRITSSTKVETNLSVYPNPAMEEFVVSFDASNESSYRFELVDLSGRVVISKTKTAALGNNTETIDVSVLPRGAYILKINTDNEVIGNARVILQ